MTCLTDNSFTPSAHAQATVLATSKSRTNRNLALWLREWAIGGLVRADNAVGDEYSCERGRIRSQALARVRRLGQALGLLLDRGVTPFGRDVADVLKERHAEEPSRDR